MTTIPVTNPTGPTIVSTLKMSSVSCGHPRCRPQFGTCEIPNCQFTAYYECIVKLHANSPDEKNLKICDEHFKDVTVDTSKMKVFFPF